MVGLVADLVVCGVFGAKLIDEEAKRCQLHGVIARHNGKLLPLYRNAVDAEQKNR